MNIKNGKVPISNITKSCQAIGIKILINSFPGRVFFERSEGVWYEITKISKR